MSRSVAALLLLLASGSARALEAAPEQLPAIPLEAMPALRDVRLLVIDVYGEVETVNWPYRTEWVYDQGKLSLRVRVKAPAGYTLRGAKYSSDTLEYLGELQAPQANIPLVVPETRVRPGRTQTRKEAELLIIWSSYEPIFWIHPSCPEAGLGFLRVAKASESALSFTVCERSGGRLAVRVKTSGTLEATGPSMNSLSGSETVVTLDDFGEPRQVGSLKIRDQKSAGASSVYEVLYDPSRFGRRWFANIALGPTYIAYREDQVPDYSSLAMSLKASIHYSVLPPDRLEAGLTSYYTVLPLSHTAGLEAARFFGLNLRVGYRLPVLRSPWSLSLAAGGYYLTMMGTANAYGFKNLSGPQLFPELRRRLSNGGTLHAYLKYSPVSAGGARFHALRSRELAVGAGVSIPRFKGRSLSFGLDVSHLALELANGGATLATLTASVGLGL